MTQIIFVAGLEALEALTDCGWELGGELKDQPPLPLQPIAREIEHECGQPGTHQYNCADCGWLPF